MNKKRTGIFDSSEGNSLDKELLKSMKGKFQGDEYAFKCYNKHKNKLPFLHKQFIHFTEQEMLEALHASAYLLQINSEKIWGNKDQIDNRALANFLNTPLELAWDNDESNLITNGQGLGFLNSFIKQALMCVTVANKGTKTIRQRLEELEYCYKVAFKTVTFGADLSITRMGSSCRFVDTQTLSNFRPLASAWIMNEYAVKPNKDKTDIWIWTPSEGWLGRLLSSYYIAYHNRDKQIHYISNDPNLKVAESHKIIVDYLKTYNPLYTADNWHPEIFVQGSEVDQTNYFKHKGWQFDLSWTSPPYGFQEQYSETYRFLLDDKQEIKVSELDPIENEDGDFILPKHIHTGTNIMYEGRLHKVISVRKLGQSRNKSKTADGWSETFFRPTCKNLFNNLNEKAYAVWNVANVRTHPYLESDTVRITQEEGLHYLGWFKYGLQRVPGAILQEDGTRINLRELKANYEPAFVFQKDTSVSIQLVEDSHKFDNLMKA